MTNDGFYRVIYRKGKTFDKSVITVITVITVSIDRLKPAYVIDRDSATQEDMNQQPESNMSVRDRDKDSDETPSSSNHTCTGRRVRFPDRL